MASTLTHDDRQFWERLLEKAEPYTENDPEYYTWDGDADPDRMDATLAKKFLDEADGNA